MAAVTPAHCCCPEVRPDAARLECCAAGKDLAADRVIQDRPERVVALALAPAWLGAGGVVAPALARFPLAARVVLAAAAGPPVPLRI
jgi:hypothetical protein